MIKRSSFGFSLLEAALALAILGIVIAGVWSLSAGAFSSNKKNRLAQQVVYTVESTRDYLRQVNLQNNSLNTQQAWDLGLLPADIRRGGNFVHPYGGDWEVNVSAAEISIRLVNLPNDACVDLVYSRLGGSDQNNNNIGLRSYATIGTSGATRDFSFNAITNNCQAQDSGKKSLELFFVP